MITIYSLFLDTHDEMVIVAIFQNGALIVNKYVSSGRDHSTKTMSLIDTALKECSITIRDINEMIVVNGPGSFTGVRIGVTIAKTFAFVLNIPIKTVSCLEMFAVSNKKGFGKLIAVRDSKGYYFAMFNQKSEMMWDHDYLPIDKFNKMIEEKSLHRMLLKDNFEIDIVETYNFCKSKPILNPHEVNPLYVKSIEVEND